MEEDFENDNDIVNDRDLHHERVIIHLDVDCFYAQVEMVKCPNLRNKPLGVKQKNLVVTSNYIAREMGVKKCMWIPEALKVCPSLVLVCGEDLYDYRQYSNDITNLLKQYGCKVEKLGLDENFVDVTELVKSRTGDAVVEGNIYNLVQERCLCGCYERLCKGSQIAKEMRDKIMNEIGLTTCGGIAHNKILAKLVGKTHKPNQQTILFPCNVGEFLRNLKYVNKLPGIGYKTSETLSCLGISTFNDLQCVDLSILKKYFNNSTALWLKDLSLGIDRSEVKESGKPQSIGIEDASRTITSKGDVEEKFVTLLKRISVLLREDGRTPSVIKVTIRKLDTGGRGSFRECRQCSISPNYLSKTEDINKDSQIMSVIMTLVRKMLDMKKPFHLTLVGLAFTKFIERSGNTLTSFVRKISKSPTIFDNQQTGNISNEKLIDRCSNLSQACDTSLKPEVVGDEFEKKDMIEDQITDPPQSSGSQIPSMKNEPTKQMILNDSFRNEELSHDRISRIIPESDSGSESSCSNIDTGNTDLIVIPSSASQKDTNIISEISECIDKNDDLKNPDQILPKECLVCPPGIDSTTFAELPYSIQKELIDSWKPIKPAGRFKKRKSGQGKITNFFQKNI